MSFGSREAASGGLRNCPALLWRMPYKPIVRDGGYSGTTTRGASTRLGGDCPGGGGAGPLFCVPRFGIFFHKVLFFWGAEALGLRVAPLTDSYAATLLCARHFYV